MHNPHPHLCTPPRTPCPYAFWTASAVFFGDCCSLNRLHIFHIPRGRVRHRKLGRIDFPNKFERRFKCPKVLSSSILSSLKRVESSLLEPSEQLRQGGALDESSAWLGPHVQRTSLQKIRIFLFYVFLFSYLFFVKNVLRKTNFT